MFQETQNGRGSAQFRTLDVPWKQTGQNEGYWTQRNVISRR